MSKAKIEPMNDNEMRCLIERHIIRQCVKHLRAAGWVAWRTFDGDEWLPMVDDAHVVAAAGNLDEISVRFIPLDVYARYLKARSVAEVEAPSEQGRAARKERTAARAACEDAEHGVLFIMGNREDVLSDWSYSEGDADGFRKAVDAFDPYEVADALKRNGVKSAAQVDQMAVRGARGHDQQPSAFFIGKEGVRLLGQCAQLQQVDGLLIAAGLKAEKLSEAMIED